MAEKRNIFLVGPMGAGKSTIGRHLADMLHLDFYDSDQEIERRTGADIAWVFDLEGEEGFSGSSSSRMWMRKKSSSRGQPRRAYSNPTRASK